MRMGATGAMNISLIQKSVLDLYRIISVLDAKICIVITVLGVSLLTIQILSKDPLSLLRGCTDVWNGSRLARSRG